MLFLLTYLLDYLLTYLRVFCELHGKLLSPKPLLKPQMHQMSFGGRVPLGRAGGALALPDPLGR